MKKNKSWQCQMGFTLIEVLIALAILSIALLAIIKATSQNIKDNTYLQNKTIATWVGTQILNNARAGILKLPEGDGLEEETTMLNKTWPWQARSVPTANPKIKKIEVEVLEPASHAPLIHLESYLYVPS